MKILELFSGYGTASFALKRLGLDYELVGYSDIDKYANQCFKQNHCLDDIEDKLRLGDVRNINPNELEDIDLITGGFPCQAFSNAGKMQGELDPRGTLFYEIIRIAEVKKPKYMLLENVKGLTSKKFKDTFDKILSELDRIGYKVYWKVLNSKDFGIPQSRARVWFVCFRKDVEHSFEFPKEVELKIFLKDILEDEVDEKYYLSEKNIKHLQRAFGAKGKILNLENKKVPTLQTAMGTGGGNIPCLIIPTLTTELAHSTGRDFYRKHAEIIGLSAGVLRKLTPKECFRLMGFLNDEINLDGLSDTQKYKLAGNGQDVNMVSLIFKEMFNKLESVKGK